MKKKIMMLLALCMLTVSGCSQNTVTVTIPKELAELPLNEYGIDASMKSGFDSTTTNDDGSITYTMSETQHDKLLKHLSETYDAFSQELINTELGIIDIDSIDANQNYSDFTVEINSEKMPLMGSMISVSFYIMGGVYAVVSGVEDPVVHIRYVSSINGEMLSEDTQDPIEVIANFSDMASGSLSETETMEETTEETTEATSEAAEPTTETTEKTEWKGGKVKETWFGCYDIMIPDCFVMTDSDDGELVYEVQNGDETDVSLTIEKTNNTISEDDYESAAAAFSYMVISQNEEAKVFKPLKTKNNCIGVRADYYENNNPNSVALLYSPETELPIFIFMVQNANSKTSYFHCFDTIIDSVSAAVTETTEPPTTEAPTEPPTTAAPTETTKPKASTITAENNADFAAILKIQDYTDSSVAQFANSYKNKTIEFDCYICDIMNHGSYSTRYDILLLPGDSGAYDGAYFKFEDVNIVSDLKLTNGDSYDSIGYGTNLHVKAKIQEWDGVAILLTPVETQIR